MKYVTVSELRPGDKIEGMGTVVQVKPESETHYEVTYMPSSSSQTVSWRGDIKLSVVPS